MTNFKYFCDFMKKASKSTNEEGFYLSYKECFPDEQLASDMFAIAHNGVKAIREMTNEGITSFAKRFDIPFRTWQKWESGEREPATYIVNLLAYTFLNDRADSNTLKRWVIIDQKDTERFTEFLDPMTKEEAYRYARDELRSMTKYDRSKRYEFFVGCCEIDEDGIEDLDTMTDEFDVLAYGSKEPTYSIFDDDGECYGYNMTFAYADNLMGNLLREHPELKDNGLCMEEEDEFDY